MKVRRKEPVREYICWQQHGDHPAVQVPHPERLTTGHHKDGSPMNEHELVAHFKGTPETHGILFTIGRIHLVVAPGDHVLSVPPEHNGGTEGYYVHHVTDEVFWEHYEKVE